MRDLRYQGWYEKGVVDVEVVGVAVVDLVGCVLYHCFAICARRCSSPAINSAMVAALCSTYGGDGARVARRTFPRLVRTVTGCARSKRWVHFRRSCELIILSHVTLSGRLRISSAICCWRLKGASTDVFVLVIASVAACGATMLALPCVLPPGGS